MIALTPIEISFLRDVWPIVRKGLNSMLKKYKDRWIPEDVYFELRSGTAFLYLLDVENETKGFLVLKNFIDVDGLALFVWIIYADAHTMKEKDRYQEVLEQLTLLAKKIGAKRIRHYSHRGGWTAKGMFDLKMHIYEREV